MGGKSHYEMFFTKNRVATIIGTPQKIMSKITKYIPINIYFCLAFQGDMKLSYYDFLFHRN